jgi:tripartite-type tricarboxylate transporter receptor subunit TctC
VTFTVNPSLYPKINYDPVKDFSPITGLVIINHALILNPQVPAKDVKELISLAKRKPGELNYGSFGIGSSGHLNMEMFQTLAGVKLTHVPYKGATPALTDVMAGHIQMMFCDVPPAMSLIQAGKIRALGVTTAQRVPAVADIPPLAEVGVPGYDTASWHTVTTTGNVPAPIVDKLYANIRDIMSDASVTEALVKDGAIPQVSPPPKELKGFVESEIVRWGKVIDQAGLAGSE